MRILVVDYGKGNIASVVKSLEFCGADVLISQEAAAVEHVHGIVLPGVGAFADAIAFMTASGQAKALRKAMEQGVPFLGICLGAQLLMDCGIEGVSGVDAQFQPDGRWAAGIGLISGHCRRLANHDACGQYFKIPHVGWNQLNFCAGAQANQDPLLVGIDDGSNFYFTHAYRAELADTSCLLAETAHSEVFPSVIRSYNAWGVQFHPEKSSSKGLRILANFLRFCGDVRS
ncbi:MAG: imidazole glycerol phosphate synthase subunit HisH [Actinomycetia bacterium]|nr:imidazole glycerol phosphate synthase subunit HisH [Actinomycetes bacterium]